MKKFIFCILFVTSLFADHIVVDQLQREVKIPDTIKRIVVLQHQSLDVLLEVGARDQIVGVLKDYSKNLGKNFTRLMPNIKNLPTPGDLQSVNYEAILALKPDLVIVSHYMNKEIIKKLESLGLNVIAMSFFIDDPKEANKMNPDIKNENFAFDEGLYQGIKILADATGHKDRGQELIDFIKESQKELKNSVSKIDLKNRVKIYMANPNFKTYGSGKYTNIIFERAGGENVAAKDIKGYKQVGYEEILKWNPQVIFIQKRYENILNDIKNDKDLATISAIKNNKIYIMPEYAKAWGHPTPEAMAIGEMWVAKKLYPKEFKELNLDERVKEFYKKFYNYNYDGK